MARGRNPIAWYAGALHAAAGLPLELLGAPKGQVGAEMASFNRGLKQGYNDFRLFDAQQWRDHVLGEVEVQVPSPSALRDRFHLERVEDIRNACAGYSDADLLAVYELIESLCQERGLMG